MSSRCPNPIELSRALVAGIDDHLQAHLAGCARCTAALKSHADVADDTRILPIHEPTVDRAQLVRAALVDAARLPAPAAGLATRRSRMFFGFAAAGALAAAAIVLVIVTRRDPSSSYRASIHPHGGASFVRVGAAPDEIVRLTQGTITVEVASLSSGERFRVVTADAEVEVRGTAFDVSVEADRLTAVRVLHGRVEIRAQGKVPMLLDAGERWDMKLAAADPREPSASPSHTAPAVAIATDVASTAPTATPSSASAPNAAPAVAIATDVASTAPAATPSSLSPPKAAKAAPEMATTTEAGSTAPAALSTAPPQAAPAAPSTARVSTVTPSSSHTPRSSTARAATSKSASTATSTARAATSTSTTPAATPATSTARAATSTSTSTSPAATTATSSAHITRNHGGSNTPTMTKRPIELLFEQGWAALAAGDMRGAAAMFERAATAAPSDPLAEDARFWQASALARAKSSQAASVLEAFLSRYPGSPRVGEASAMLGWIVIANNDLDRAEALFKRAANDRVPAVRASADKGLAAVAKRR